MHDVVKADVQRIMDITGAAPGEIGRAVAQKLVPELRAAWPGAVPEGDVPLAEALDLAGHAKGSGFVFVIDEWDCVFRLAADDKDAQRSYLDFLRGLFKGSPWIDAAYMTGILPIKKYGAHSALNVFTEYSMTDPDVLAPLTGFNADEVERLCERFGKDPAEIARWYDGYQLGLDRLHVYNPNSVAQAISSGVYDSYWTRTETYEALQHYIDMDFDGVASDLLLMLDGARVPAEVAYLENDMTTFKSKDDVYALLAHLGYLGYDQVERAVFIPNEEIRREFVRSIETGARPGLARLAAESRELIRATHDGDCAYVADALDRAHSWAAAPRWYNDEQALRAAVKFAYIAAMDDYLRIDELPGGKGFADVAFIPKPGSKLPPMVVELKWNRPADAALAQIRTRNYPAALSSLSGECVLAGVTYDADSKRHECAIERIEL